MLDQAYFKTVEHLVGVGQVFEQSKEVTSVNYNIKVLKKMIKIRTMTEASIIEGMEQIQGFVKPINNTLALRGENFTLVIEDGRQLDFFMSDLGTGAITARSKIYSLDHELQYNK